MDILKPRKSYQPTLLKVWRIHRGLTQERLAERVGTTKATISRLEKGRMGYSQPMLERIAEALNCGPADIISRRPGEPIDDAQRILERMGEEERGQAVRVLKAMFPISKVG